MSCLSDVASKLSLSSIVHQHPPFISHRETHDHHPSPLSHPTLVEVIKQPGDLIQHMQNTGGSRPQGRHNEDGWHALSTWSFTKARHIFWLILWELSTWLLRNKQKMSLLLRQLWGERKKYFQKHMPAFATMCTYLCLEKNPNKTHSFHHAATRQLCILAGEKVCGSSSKCCRMEGTSWQIFTVYVPIVLG